MFDQSCGSDNSARTLQGLISSLDFAAPSTNEESNRSFVVG
jgi:hypothetical protein